MAHAKIVIRPTLLLKDFTQLKGKVLLLGGSFDPVHSGHIAIAKHALKHFELDMVICMPLSHNPLKSQKPVASAKDRLSMLETALRDDPKFFLSDYEINKAGKTYTIDTLRHIRIECERSVKLYLVLGTDNLSALHNWREYEKLWDYAEIIAIARQGVYVDELEKLCCALSAPIIQRLKQHFLSLECPFSSSSIRMQIAKGELKEPSEALPEGVFKYICEHGLYRAST